MDISEPSTTNNSWEIRKEKAIPKSNKIRDAKVKGEEHVNHKGKLVKEKQIGENCRCKKFKCFEVISQDMRQDIFSKFYAMPTKNQQDAHLCGLIRMNNVKRRRIRMRGINIERSKPHSSVFTYKIRSVCNEISVCKTAFLNIHAITPARLKRLQNHLVTTGHSPIDGRGRHKNRFGMYPSCVVDIIMDHIKSFKPRQSHYSRRKNPDHAYLSEGLTVKDMHKMFLAQYLINIPYKLYWKIFKTKFKIKFGFPKSDTCPECDTYIQKLNNVNITDEEKNAVCIQREIHLRKAEAFFTAKRNFKLKAKAGELVCISFDYMQNLPLPHIPTNPVFYSRQLWYNVFGIHDLGTDEVSIYTYTEDQAKKGANDVTSMLLHYINNNHFDSKHLVLISDGCPGQNKNNIMFHFLFAVVHVLKVFDTITYLFPMRGHSFLPNDQDFALIEKKKRRIQRAEIPEDWDKIIVSARTKPSPFRLVKMDPARIFNIKQATDKYFLKTSKPPLRIKQIRMLEISQDSPLIKVRHNYSGAWTTPIVRNNVKLSHGLHLERAYPLGMVEISCSKLKNLKDLLGFLELPENRQFFQKIFRKQNFEAVDEYPEIDEDDNSSGCEDL